MVDIPHPDDLQNEDVPNIEKVFERLPISLHLGDPVRGPNTIIGWSNAFRDKDTGETTIVMTIDGEASEKLGDLVEVFKLYAIGFAGVARREEPNDSSRKHGARS